MNLRFATLTAGLWLAAGVVCSAAPLDDVLGRMDAAAKQFQSYSASLKRTDYTKVLDSTEESIGTMRLKRSKIGMIGILDTTTGGDHTIIEFKGPLLRRYLPKAATVQEFNAKKFASIMDQMLLLGFAVTSDEIKRDYDAAYVGEENLDGVATSHITLKPKSADALKYVRTVELWINPKGNAIRQKGTEPQGNYRLVMFSNLEVNPSLPDSAFQLDLPKGTKVVKEN